MPEATAPRATKTTVKPAMKSPMPRSIGRMVTTPTAPLPEADAWVAVSSAAEKPETMET